MNTFKLFLCLDHDVVCLSSLTGIEDILVKPEADQKRQKIIEKSNQHGIEVSRFCRAFFS